MNIIVLRDEFAEISIAPALGASILSYNYYIDGAIRPILRESRKAKLVEDTSCFPLVPFSNRIRNGSFTWEEAIINLPLNNLPEKHSNHGHGWQVPWNVIYQTEKNAILQYHHAADDWPFSYVTTQEIKLIDGKLRVELSIKSTGDGTMPVGLGLHPYFTRTEKSSLTAEIKEMWEVDEECLPIKIANAPLSLSQPQGMNINSEQLDNALIDFRQKAKVIWPEWGIRAELSASDNCKHLVVYSPKDTQFFCAEPVTHCTDAINMYNQGNQNTGLKILNSDEELYIWMQITPSVMS